MQGCTPEKRSKVTEINQLLGRTASNVSEGGAMAEEINITLLQERIPDDEDKAQSEEPKVASGWFDTVITRLIGINRKAEIINLHLKKLHNEVANK